MHILTSIIIGIIVVAILYWAYKVWFSNESSASDTTSDGSNGSDKSDNEVNKKTE